MNILIAPDSFKGSISAKEFCDIAEKAIKSVLPSANVIKIPMADGGEGTIEALILNTCGEIKKTIVTDPLGNAISASYGILGDKKTAIIEMASSSGLSLVPKEHRNPMETTTFGTGELILKALDDGCTKIIIGIGGSATNDGGAGMAEALGFKLLDEHDKIIDRGANGLFKINKIDTSKKDSRLNSVEFLAACDVNNPLCGPYGASYVYASQKGATKEQLPILDRALNKLSDEIKINLNIDVLNVPGAGAAGGLGAGILAFLNAQLRPGFEIIMEETGLDKVFVKNKIDLVITGEGEINHQTLNGKLPVGVSRIARKYSVPTLAIVGSYGEGAEKTYALGVDSIISIIDKPMQLDDAVNNATMLLYRCIKNQFKLLDSLKCLS
ncbi:MAG: glycerate kinase [Clostridiales bacterium]|nr:glycerate kinase [Clostridiales bacterium]